MFEPRDNPTGDHVEQIPKLGRPWYVLAVPDLARSAAYYRDVLGFTVREIGDHSYFAYVEVQPIDPFYAEVTARGVQLVKRLRDEPWGRREFGIRTVDGHRMMFGAPSR